MRRVCSSLLAVYSCLILLRSLAHTFAGSTDWQGHQGCITVVKLVLITIHPQPLRSYTGEHWVWILSSISSSAPALFTNTLSLTKSLPGWGDSPRSPPLQKKYGGHFVWCWLNEWWVQLRLYDCPYTKKTPPYAAERQFLLGAWPSFFRGHYSSCSWIYIKATDRIQQNSWK